MHTVIGPVRYFYLRKPRGQEDVPDWPPLTKPLEGPDNKVCAAVRLYADAAGWRAEYVESLLAPVTSADPAFVLNRNTALGLLHDGKRTKADVQLLGVRVVNFESKGVEFATHLVVRAMAGSGASLSRRPVVVPADAIVLGEYIEHGDRAVAALDLRITPAEYANMPLFLADARILPAARRALDQTVLSTARFYSYGNVAKHGISLEVEAGRVSMHGRVDLRDVGDQVRAAMLATPGVVEVADHLLYVEDLQVNVQDALAAKGLGNLQVLSEHALIILDGVVADSKTRYQAEDIAAKIPGVRGVVNNIVVRAQIAKA
jgi:hypothetical protein